MDQVGVDYIFISHLQNKKGQIFEVTFRLIHYKEGMICALIRQLSIVESVKTMMIWKKHFFYEIKNLREYPLIYRSKNVWTMITNCKYILLMFT